MPAYDGKVIAVFALLRELTYNNCAFIRRKLMKVKQFLAALLLLSFSTLALADPFFGYGWGGGLIGLIVLILDIVAIVEIVGSGKSAGEKVLWIVEILLLPLIGLILYYLLGR